MAKRKGHASIRWRKIKETQRSKWGGMAVEKQEEEREGRLD